MEQVLESNAGHAPAAAISARGSSAVSWGAIAAGAGVAAAASLILLALGTGLGFASLSPWAGHGVSVTAFAAASAIWLIVTQWISSGVGGYVTGRLRTKWAGTHVHEIFFRDTAHGLITWSAATLLVAAVFGHSANSALNAASQLAAGPAGAAAPAAYDIDKLFRAAIVVPAASDAKIEAGGIAANAVKVGGVPDADRNYLVELVGARASITRPDAQQRVDQFIAGVMAEKTKLEAEAAAASKAAATAAILTSLSLLVGAFIASVSAALGGRLRDQHI